MDLMTDSYTESDWVNNCKSSYISKVVVTAQPCQMQELSSNVDII